MRLAQMLGFWILVGACATAEEQAGPATPEEPGVRTRGLTKAGTRSATTTATNTLLVQNIRTRFATYSANPNDSSRTSFETYVEGQMRTSTGVMSALFQVLKEAVEQARADKQYYLERLASMNDISQAMSDYLTQTAEMGEVLGSSPSDNGVCTCKDEGTQATEAAVRSGTNLENVLAIRRRSVTYTTVGRDIDVLLTQVRRERTVVTAMSRFLQRLRTARR